MSLDVKLNYLSVISRPELSFVVSSLGQVLKNRSHDHYLWAKKALRYLRATFVIGIFFKHSECLELDGFFNSDSRGDPNDERYASVHCFKFSVDSSLTCWSSLKQQTVALSSTEAE